jgi:LPS sulfotransferase NodH
MVSDYYDAPTDIPPEQIKRLIVCTMPRTASHALCDALRRSGWGLATEYFFPSYTLPLQRRLLQQDVADAAQARTLAKPYGDKLLALRTANGIFATKAFYGDMEFIREALGNDGPNWFYIYLQRNDKVAQVISLATTRLTNRVFDSDAEAEFAGNIDSINERTMAHILGWFIEQEATWKKYLLRLDPARFISVSTEDFVSDPLRVLNGIAKRFRLPGPAPGIDVAAIRGGRYKADAAIKRDLQRRYGDMLAKLVSRSR